MQQCNNQISVPVGKAQKTEDYSVRILCTIPGLFVILLGIIFLRFYWGPLFLEETFDLAWQKILINWLITSLLLVSGLGLSLWGWWKGSSFPWASFLEQSWFVNKIINSVKWIFPPLNPFIIQLALIILVTNLFYLGIVQYKEGFYFNQGLTWIYFVRTLIMETGIFISVVLFFHLTLRPLALLSAFLLIFSRLIDGVIYYFGHSHLEIYHLKQLANFPIKSLITPGGLMLMGWTLFATLLVALKLYGRKGRNIPSSYCIRWSLFLLVFVFIGPHQIYYAIERLNYRGAYELQFHRATFERLDYSTQHSIYNLVEQLTNNFDPSRVQTVETDDDFKEVIAAYQLPIGNHQVPDLGLIPFKRVVVITVESLSNVLLSAHNPKLESNNSAQFFSQPWVLKNTLTHFRPSILYTEQGLTVILTSHPNQLVAYSTKYRASFVHLLAQAGFKTLMIRADSRFYAQGQVHFTRAGFQNIISREDFLSDPNTKKYAEDWWGVCDRILLDRIVSELEKSRDDKIFIMGLTVDSHVPDGREDRHGLEYGVYEPEPNMEDTGPHMLKAFFHVDFDLAYFVEQLRLKNLWDSETLIVITADHGAPLSGSWQNVPGFPDDNLHPVPLIILTPQQLPFPARNIRSSQVDIGPSLLHLLDLPIPAGYWGTSLFAPDEPHNFVGYYRSHHLVFENQDALLKVDLDKPSTELHKQAVELFWTQITSGLVGRDDALGW